MKRCILHHIVIIVFLSILPISLYSKLFDEAEMTFILETERLVLREFTMEDAQELLKLFSDSDVMHFSVSGPLDMAGVKNFLKKMLQSYQEHGYGKWAVILKETGELIGACGIHRVKIDDEILIEIGYRLKKNHWNKGLATEAAIAIRDYGFKTLNLPYFVSCIHPDNRASIRVAQKNGMTYWSKGTFFGVPCLVFGIRQ